jgi:hypothetical protein
MTQRYAPQLPCALEVHPTEEEFAEPMRYIQLLHQRYGKEHGIVKIVPPKDWNPGLGISFDEFTFTTCEQQIDQLNHRCDLNDAHVLFVKQNASARSCITHAAAGTAQMLSSSESCVVSSRLMKPL